MKNPESLTKHFNVSVGDVWKEFIGINSGGQGYNSKIVKCASLSVPTDNIMGTPSVRMKYLGPCLNRS